MRYQELFRTPEFTPLFLCTALQVAGQTVSGLALSVLMYGATGSPLLSALAMFGPSLAQVIGATTLLSAADRLPPRAALTGMALLLGLGSVAQALPGLPVMAAFALLLALGVPASPVGGVRYGLLNELLSPEGYLLGRSVLNMSVGALQTCGFAAGGALMAALSPRGTLLVGAALYVAAAAVARFGLAGRAPRATGRPSVTRTWRSNAVLWSSRPRRYVLLALWVPNGLVVGCESLYVPYAPRNSGLLFACGALGMLAGDTLAGRFLPHRLRERLGVPLCVLLAAPYLLFALRPSLPVAMAAVALATIGYAASLLLQERLVLLTPVELSGLPWGCTPPACSPSRASAPPSPVASPSTHLLRRRSPEQQPCPWWSRWPSHRGCASGRSHPGRMTSLALRPRPLPAPPGTTLRASPHSQRRSPLPSASPTPRSTRRDAPEERQPLAFPNRVSGPSRGARRAPERRCDSPAPPTRAKADPGPSSGIRSCCVAGRDLRRTLSPAVVFRTVA